MKKILFTIGFLLLAYISIGQVTNTRVLRVANNTTAIGENLPTGSYIYDMNAKILYVLDAAAASTATLTTIGASKTAINGTPSTEVEDYTLMAGYTSGNFNADVTHGVSQDDFYDYNAVGDTDDDGLTNKVDLSSAGFVKTDASGNLSVDGNTYLTSEVDGSTSNELQNLSYDAPNHQIDIDLGGTSATIPLAVDDGATEGLASFAAADFTATAGNIVIDYANGQAATGSQDGFLQSTDWTTFNNKLSVEVDGSITNEGSLTVTDGSDEADIVSNTSGSTNVSIVGGTGINVEGTAGHITINYDGTAAYTRITQFVEVAADDLTQPYPVTLAQTPNATTKITVQINGVPLKYQAGTTNGTFNYSGTALSIYALVYQYDQIEIDYEY